MIGISGTVFSLVGGWLGDRFGLKRSPSGRGSFSSFSSIGPADRRPRAHAARRHRADAGADGPAGDERLGRHRADPQMLPAGGAHRGAVDRLRHWRRHIGGSAQVIFTWLIAETGEPTAHVWWVILSNLITICALIAIQPLPDEAPQPTEER